MEYCKIIETISESKREGLSTRLINVIQLSKSDDKISGKLANTYEHAQTLHFISGNKILQ